MKFILDSIAIYRNPRDIVLTIDVGTSIGFRTEKSLHTNTYIYIHIIVVYFLFFSRFKGSREQDFELVICVCLYLYESESSTIFKADCF